jgi:isopenicillin-N N-acyltransferase-like protein
MGCRLEQRAMTVHRFESETADPFDRGVELGEFGAAQIAANVESYSELFEAVGVGRDQLREIGMAALTRIAAWSGDLSAEIAGYAFGARVEPWMIGLLNARTEVLATVGAMGEGECSTVVVLPPSGAPRTVQTWDWHDVSNDETLVVKYVARAGHVVRYFTEFGIVGKVGVNSAGIGVHFNILNHTADGDGIGVPVHVVARAVLDRATSLEEAIEIIGSAAVTASTVLTVVEFVNGVSRAASVELSPAGVGVVHTPADGFLVHTNHFLDPVLAHSEMVPPTSSSYPRLRLLHERHGALAAMDPLQRAVAMTVHESDGAPVCCHPDPAQTFENRWQTLLTISLDVENSALQFHEGGPCTATRETWQVFGA